MTTRYAICSPEGAVIAASDFSAIAWALAIERGDTEGCECRLFDSEKQEVRGGRISDKVEGRVQL